MTQRLGPILLVMVVLLATCAWAQSDTSTQDTGAPAQVGPTPAYTYPDATPSLDFLSGSVENSKLTLGITTGFSYDSNLYSVSTTNQNFWLFQVTPNIKIQQFRPTLSWNVSYAGGYQAYTQLNGKVNPNNNLFSQRAGAGFLWQLAPHWQLSADDHFTYSANPFDSFLTTVGNPTLNNPNPVTYYPLTQYTLNGGLMTLTNQMTKVDTLTFTGTANLRRTSTYNLLSYPFYNLISYGGRGTYSHQFSPRLSLGAGYDYNSLDFGKGQQRSGIQTITMTADYVIRPNMTISGWVGPEYTTTKTVVSFLGQTFITHDSLWSTSLGATFGWQSLRNSVRAGFTRSVSDGGGIIGTSQVNSIDGSYHRMLSAKMDVMVGGRYFHDVSTTIANRVYNNMYLDASLNYKLTKSLKATGQYAFLRQTQPNSILLRNTTYNSNIVGVTVNYTWDHPLGR